MNQEIIHYYIMNKQGDIIKLSTCIEEDWINIIKQARHNSNFACFINEEEYNNIKKELINKIDKSLNNIRKTNKKFKKFQDRYDEVKKEIDKILLNNGLEDYTHYYIDELVEELIKSKDISEEVLTKIIDKAMKIYSK